MKGILLEQLEEWSQGLQFLRKPQKEWPKFEENALKINEELSAEMKPPIEARPTSGDKASTLRLQEPHLRIKKAILDCGSTSHGKTSNREMCDLQKTAKEAIGAVNGIGLVRKAKIKTAMSVYDRPTRICLIVTKKELNSMP